MNFKSEYQIYLFLRDKLCLYGIPMLFGSANREMAFIQGHDFDIGLYTDFKSQEYLTEICRNTAKAYEIELSNKRYYIIPLHFLIIGDFSYEFVPLKLNKIEHFIHFIPKNIKWWIVLWWKLRKLVWKASKNKSIKNT
jgi:hypothetical protein